mmetsp:Transcript_30484/g.87009  ORF Transcript_30484/g.87009 Transcript_30484/m.87009 type:complete len:84 (-) Transcript_30484:915-1166(-)
MVRGGCEARTGGGDATRAERAEKAVATDCPRAEAQMSVGFGEACRGCERALWDEPMVARRPLGDVGPTDGLRPRADLGPGLEE